MTRTAHPTLRPGTRVLDRSEGEVQLGSHHARAIVLAGLSAADREVVHTLDGTRSPAELSRCYLARGEDPARLPQLLEVLASNDLLGPAAPSVEPWLRARRPGGRPPVLVAGVGNLAAEIQRAFTLQGVRAHAQSDLAPSALPTVPAAARGSRRGPALTVLVADGAVDPLVARQWAPWAMVLPVVSSDGVATIGPLWADLEDPCPMCLDHFRTDRDPAWPRLLSQLTARTSDGTPRPARTDPATTAVAAGLTLTTALDALGPRQLARGTSVDVIPDTVDVVRRVWAVHPRCVTHAPAAEALAG